MEVLPDELFKNKAHEVFVDFDEAQNFGFLKEKLDGVKFHKLD